MVTSFRGTFITFALIGLLVFATISFVFGFQRDNEIDETILENPIINSTFNRLGTNLSSFGSDTQTQRATFESEVPERGFASLIIFSVVSFAQKSTGLVVAVYNVLIISPASILGISPVVFSVLNAIFLLSLILLAWRVYRVGG